jgi:copper chaperone CopZ
MTHTYNVKGMSCGGCKASVEKYLGQVDNVTKVIANIEKGEADVTMSSHVATETLKKALPEKYTLSEKETKNMVQSANKASD